MLLLHVRCSQLLGPPLFGSPLLSQFSDTRIDEVFHLLAPSSTHADPTEYRQYPTLRRHPVVLAGARIA
jgi:hypothetical protein